MCLAPVLGILSNSSITPSPTLTVTTSASSYDGGDDGRWRGHDNWHFDPPTAPTDPRDHLPYSVIRKKTSESSTSPEIIPKSPLRRTTTTPPHRMYNPEGSRMGERRPLPGMDSQQTAASTSTHVRGSSLPQRSTTLPVPTRQRTPPASSYFRTSQGNDNSEPQPIVADAGSHFAYSTTLRRHHYELTSPTTAIQNITHGDWQGALDSFSRGTQSRHSLDRTRQSGAAYPSKGLGTPQNAPDTPSSKFSHSTIEV